MTVRQRVRGVAAVVAMTVAATAVGLAWYALDHPLEPRGRLWLFVLAAALGERFPFPQVRGRDVPVSVAVVAAFALLGNPPLQVAVVAVGGWALVAMQTAREGGRPRWLDLLASASGAWATAGFAALAAAAMPWATIAAHGSPDQPVHVAAVLAVWGTVVLGVPLWEAVEVTGRTGAPTLPIHLGLVRSSWTRGMALASAAALGALVHSVLGVWTLPLLLLPLLAARLGLVRHATVQRTAAQTVRAMSRLPEELGSVSRGHGVRVGSLAVAIARELGVSDPEVADVERAAHLHELGRIQGEPGEELEDRAVALAGASIVRETGSLDRVADLIERHPDPYRVAGLGEDGTLPIGARIVRTVCAFDRELSRAHGDQAVWRALEHLHAGSAYAHDPVVLGALTRILGRQGRI